MSGHLPAEGPWVVSSGAVLSVRTLRTIANAGISVEVL